MEKTFRRWWFLGVLWLLSAASTLADGVAVPTAGGVLVLSGRTLTEVRSLEFKEQEVPRLAVHPSSPILASLSGDRLQFWNLPSFAEASRHENALFEGAHSLAFSQDGAALFLLSPELRAVLKFDLATSRVVGTLPVPGGDPLWMEVIPEGVLVGQADSLSLLSPEPRLGLLAQFRFPDRLNSAAVERGRLLLAREGVAGLDSYEIKTGRAVEFVPTSSTFEHLVSEAGRLYALSPGGEVQALSPDASRALWTYSDSSLSPDRLVAGADGSLLYVFDHSKGVLISLDALSGQENARIQLSGAGRGVPVIFTGNL